MKKTPENQGDVVSLVKQAQDRFAKLLDEVAAQDARNEEGIRNLAKKEASLKQQIASDRARVDVMADEYEDLEKKKKEALTVEFQKTEFTKQDVLDGKISLIQFQSQGLSDEAAQKVVMNSTLEALKKASDLIRTLQTEIIKKEIELAKTQSTAFGLLLNPARNLLRAHRELADSMDHQLGPVVEHSTIARTHQKQSEEELMIAEQGSGMGNSHQWGPLTAAESRRLIHNPLLPKSEIVSLLSQLNGMESGAMVTVLFRFPHFWPGEEPVVVTEQPETE